MEKGEISGRFNTLRNRGEGKDKGIYWVSRRLGTIRNIFVIVGFCAFGTYIYFWFKKHGEKLKSPCQKAYELEFEGPVVSVFLDENSNGIVSVKVLNNSDTVEYFTGWGGIKNAGEAVHKGDYLKKQPNSFNLFVFDGMVVGKTQMLRATETKCE